MTIVAGDTLTAFTNGSGAEDTIEHWDTTGAHVETITLPSGSLGSGNQLYIMDMKQYGSSVYVSVTDQFNNYDAVIELDTSLAYVREVLVMNRSDPDQDPGLGKTIGRIDVRQTDGHVFAKDDSFTRNLWEYANDGTFIGLQIIDDISGVASSNQSGAPIISIVNENIVTVNELDDSTSPDEQVLRHWNVSTQTVASDTRISVPTPATLGEPGDFACDGTFYVTVQDRSVLPNTSTLYIYDSTWSLLSTVSLPIPSGYDQLEFGLVTEDGLYLWMQGQKTSDGSWALFQYELASNTVLIGPITFTPASASGLTHFVYVTTPCGVLPVFPGFGRVPRVGTTQDLFTRTTP